MSLLVLIGCYHKSVILDELLMYWWLTQFYHVQKSSCVDGKKIGLLHSSSMSKTQTYGNLNTSTIPNIYIVVVVYYYVSLLSPPFGCQTIHNVDYYYYINYTVKYNIIIREFH